MARFNANDADKYGGQGGGGYFSLKNDKEVAQIRFLYDNIDDVEGLSVHQVTVGGKKRYVNCLREYNDPVDACPFCRAGKYTQAKLFIPVYHIKEDKVLVWERGKQFFQVMSSLCARYGEGGLVSHVFEIERHGKPNDTNTTYQPYEVSQDDTTMEDFPEAKTVASGIVLDKTAEDMEYYLESGEFPPEDDAPVRRRNDRSERSERGGRGSEEPTERRAGRRTPARRGGNAEDVY